MSQRDGVWVFDNTELDFYRKCPRYYLYRVIHEKTGHDDALPLQFGIAVHMAIEHVLKGGTWDVGTQMAVDYFAPYDNGADLKRSIGTLRHILTHYFAYYSPETFHADEGMVEVGFAINLARDVVFTGRLDAFGSYEGYPGKWVFDNKTAWRVDDYQLKPHNQFSGYCAAGYEYFENMNGLLANLILVAKDACTMKVRGEGYLKGKAPEDCFFRTATQRTVAELLKWREETLYWVDQIRRSIDDNRWPQNTTYGCKAFNHQCEFYPVCIQPSEGEQIELLNSPIFKTNIWQPYVKEGEEVSDQRTTQSNSETETQTTVNVMTM